MIFKIDIRHLKALQVLTFSPSFMDPSEYPKQLVSRWYVARLETVKNVSWRPVTAGWYAIATNPQMVMAVPVTLVKEEKGDVGCWSFAPWLVPETDKQESMVCSTTQNRVACTVEPKMQEIDCKPERSAINRIGKLERQFRVPEWDECRCEKPHEFIIRPSILAKLAAALSYPDHPAVGAVVVDHEMRPSVPVMWNGRNTRQIICRFREPEMVPYMALEDMELPNKQEHLQCHNLDWMTPEQQKVLNEAIGVKEDYEPKRYRK